MGRGSAILISVSEALQPEGYIVKWRVIICFFILHVTFIGQARSNVHSGAELMDKGVSQGIHNDEFLCTCNEKNEVVFAQTFEGWPAESYTVIRIL